MSKREIKGRILEDKFKDYAKKPVVVQAYQTEEELAIETLEGTMKANVGDYIIKGIEGELYPCKPDIFAKTYEEPSDELDLHSDFEEWDNFITELSEKEVELINLKEMYVQLEQEIIETTDFKELYGKNNESVRRNHVKNELKDMVDKRNELEISIPYIKRKISFIKSMIAMKIQLIKYGDGK